MHNYLFADMTTLPPKSMDSVRAVLLIVLITGSVHLVGSAILFGIISGPLAVLASPLLAVFGWFFVFPELVGVTIQWMAYHPSRGKRSFWRVFVVSVSTACLIMALIGPKEEGDGLRWTFAYVVATGAAASWSMLAIYLAKRFLVCEDDQRTNRLAFSSRREMPEPEWFWRCPACQLICTELTKSKLKERLGDNCPVCGARVVEGAFRRFIQPVAFRHDADAKISFGRTPRYASGRD